MGSIVPDSTSGNYRSTNSASPLAMTSGYCKHSTPSHSRTVPAGAATEQHSLSQLRRRPAGKRGTTGRAHLPGQCGMNAWTWVVIVLGLKRRVSPCCSHRIGRCSPGAGHTRSQGRLVGDHGDR
jgi:hypothetical protein